ncbi:MAG: T9SS type A sorting domain-containing protein [Ferruginibacter sp.]
MKKLLSIILCFICNFTFAQETFLTSGGYSENSSGSVSSSVGELNYQSRNFSNGLFIEGVQQPYDTNNVVPVTLLYFYVTKQQSPNRVLLNWATVSENNVEKFLIERSSDAQTFNFLLEELAVGRIDERTNYNRLDDSPLQGQSFYRLKKLDRDGSYSYSEVVPINFSENFGITAYPNPTTDFVQLLYNGTDHQNLNYFLTDINGRRIKEGLLKTSSTKIVLNNITSGVYILTVMKDGKIIKNFRIIKGN